MRKTIATLIAGGILSITAALGGCLSPVSTLIPPPHDFEHYLFEGYIKGFPELDPSRGFGFSGFRTKEGEIKYVLTDAGSGEAWMYAYDKSSGEVTLEGLLGNFPAYYREQGIGEEIGYFDGNDKLDFIRGISSEGKAYWYEDDGTGNFVQLYLNGEERIFDRFPSQDVKKPFGLAIAYWKTGKKITTPQTAIAVVDKPVDCGCRGILPNGNEVKLCVYWEERYETILEFDLPSLATHFGVTAYDHDGDGDIEVLVMIPGEPGARLYDNLDY